jgi:ribonuclease HII
MLSFSIVDIFWHNLYMKYLIGIDEVGRGCIAGPVAVGACIIFDRKNKKLFKGVKDSKQLSPKNREFWLEKMMSLQKVGKLDFSISFQDQKVIDEKGISFAIKKALNDCLMKLEVLPDEVEILLDGGLKAPQHFLNQKTIIKGDEKEVVISLASICAKVIRDKMMVDISKKVKNYGFDIHKGYGTKKHYEAIRKHGISKIHRKSFLKGFVK